MAVVGPVGLGQVHARAAAVSASTTSPAGASSSTGRTCATCSSRALRAAIGIVPQDTVLFNDSIEYNIAYGRPGATPRRDRARRRGSRRSTISSSARPRATQTPVGERGLKLSGGEKQRVAIARAMLKDPRDPDLRRGDLRARLEIGEGDPGRAEADRARPHDADHRASAVDDRRRRRDPGARARPDRRARHPRGAARRRRRLCADVAPAAGRGRAGAGGGASCARRGVARLEPGSRSRRRCASPDAAPARCGSCNSPRTVCSVLAPIRRLTRRARARAIRPLESEV